MLSTCFIFSDDQILKQDLFYFIYRNLHQGTGKTERAHLTKLKWYPKPLHSEEDHKHLYHRVILIVRCWQLFREEINNKLRASPP